MIEQVLIVDDNLFNQKVLGDMLDKEYSIEYALDGQLAVEIVKDSSPRIILLNVTMLKTDGFQVLKDLKNDIDTRDIPVIIMSNLPSEKEETKGFTLGAVDYIARPFHDNVVKARIKTHIQLFLYRKAIENLIVVDSLTGIHNRRGFDECIRNEWRRARREQHPLSFALLDIDFFKKYNDNYGHLNGDEVLKSVATCINMSVSRSSDYVARYGGEEFAIIMPNTPKAGGTVIAQKILSNIYDLQIPHNFSDVVPFITLSIGGITAIPKSDDHKSFLSLADKMLYRAKESGRNRYFWD